MEPNLFRRGSNVNFNTIGGSPSHTYLTDRNISGNTLLAHSPLHDNQGERGPLASLLYSQTENHEVPVVSSMLPYLDKFYAILPNIT